MNNQPKLKDHFKGKMNSLRSPLLSPFNYSKDMEIGLDLR